MNDMRFYERRIGVEEDERRLNQGEERQWECFTNKHFEVAGNSTRDITAKGSARPGTPRSAPPAFEWIPTVLRYFRTARYLHVLIVIIIQPPLARA